VILRPGDKVAIVAPAAQLPEAEAGLLESGAALLEKWGLRVTIQVERRRHFYLAGTDAERAAHLQAAVADPEIRAILAARGGYGCTRLFPHLRPHFICARKLLVGYSDVTALHLAASQLWPQVESIHGPNIASPEFLGLELAAEVKRLWLYRALFDPAYEVDVPVEFLRQGRASGPLRGGCLSLLAGALGTRFAPASEGAIVFLEDIDEAPYRIDRLLVQLRNAGLFADVAGVVFGVMHRCADGMNDLRDVIRDVLSDYTFPIAFGLPAGHGESNVALPLGAPATLEGASGHFKLHRRR